MPWQARPLTAKEIRKAARAAISALEQHNLRSCLFGSAACALYGMANRIPNVNILFYPFITVVDDSVQDADVIVLTRMHTEDIKDILVGTNNKFFLVPSADPRNDWRVLWYLLYSGPRGSPPRSCKVDILIPGGDLRIPRIPISRIVYVERFPDLPLVPFLALLFLKLQGWSDNRGSDVPRKREKQYADLEDISELLALAVEEFGSTLQGERWMPKGFIRKTRGRVQKFVEEFPDSAYYWSEIGFNVD